MTVFFSGRFCRPHCGHVATIQHLMEKFGRVVVIVLDYPEQKFPLAYRMEVLGEILERSHGECAVISNKEHFGFITADQVDALQQKYGWKMDLYASGNLQCVEHMHDLGYDALYTPRSWDYEASKEK